MQVDGINPAVLEWARKTAGLSIEDAAQRIGLSTGQKESAAEKLDAIERGDRSLTPAQLIKMAAAYHRPLLSLYMSEPPRPADRGEDFRTMVAFVAPDEAARLDALVRDIRARHAILRDLMSDDEDVAPRTFVGSLPITTSVKQAASKIRDALGVLDEDELRRAAARPDQLFVEVRRRVEALGVFVLLLGDLGNYKTAVSSSVFRGFALADDLAPVIVINDQDAKTAWTFTLVHELVHLFIGSTGVSGAPTTVEPHTPTARVERFCNDVAGEFLLPDHALARIAHVDTAKSVIELAEVLADTWKVSTAMAAYRLWSAGKTNTAAYGEAVRMLAERWRLHRQREKDKAKDNDGGPNYYVVRRHRLGDALLQVVGRNLRSDTITHTTAARVFGVRPGAVEDLLAGVPGLGSPRPTRER
ncbi:ImmA/IrrE family metallo-endopeptidase [Aurantimonas sp. VKM B-3413]|uniref:ImmA/IrrE family metallo-endopeptidase n=1 Tax=Aurantimonas sp. VKM B-3413 TaxID=2779401 RepID=UPI001E5DAA54|nr:XRE family transcriptional regulator [Aurantimonas sp. VKM B-3413]MCB8839624.1 XRE family transcriptional regulator [Aurantimonas sp. VKM B-3413]